MLSLTKLAATLVRTQTNRANSSADAGLRIVVDPVHNSLSMGIANGPSSADVIVAKDGARVFLSPSAADRLTDRTMGAEISVDRSAFFLHR
jgi:Fe-S cluster assembly iron-binding protein IscA